MHLTSQLIPALVCLLACTSNCLHGRELILLQEIIKTLNNLTETKDRYMELTVAEVLPVPKNTTEKEAFCRAAMELRKIYPPHPKDVTGKHLSKLDRNLSRLANMVSKLVSNKHAMMSSSDKCFEEEYRNREHK
uniref:Interleukin-4 n=1 Tax=Rhinolophus ferrumequinum TaxID=59479 RepID=A0A671FLF1_RHIFE